MTDCRGAERADLCGSDGCVELLVTPFNSHDIDGHFSKNEKIQLKVIIAFLLWSLLNSLTCSHHFFHDNQEKDLTL